MSDLQRMIEALVVSSKRRHNLPDKRRRCSFVEVTARALRDPVEILREYFCFCHATIVLPGLRFSDAVPPLHKRERADEETAGLVLGRQGPAQQSSRAQLECELFALQGDHMDNVQRRRPERAKSSKRIDGISATITALARAMVSVENTTTYTEVRSVG